ncbi:NAD(P)/FAD-dependent oxidoreductase [Novosphingobium terrae]|uniref:NAD(P)/FAD-dependent oxidoreductase n=1 Tax=Novosphingobium terrae TaxID=2726189 RepID=UPI001981280D|nr:FAD-dependent oxidoreductase [Novosphingobium terrae]
MVQCYDVIIVGGGHGGAHTAIALRQHGFTGSIAIVGDEAELPYERPPLSKEYFSGEKVRERLFIRPEAFWQDKNITLITSERVVSIDAEAHSITTAAGRSFGYGRLVWAAGGAPRRLPLDKGNAANVLAIRTLADADRLREAAAAVRRVAIIGGGYIGLEAAAVLTKAGKQVTLLEMQDRVLARAAGEALSRFVEQAHRTHGVDLRVGIAIEALEGDALVTGVRLAGGEVIPCDLLIVGIGIVPEVAPLEAAGATVGNGVLVDERCATSLADIYAIGDLAAHANSFADGATVRLESVQNAVDMAMTVARTIAGEAVTYAALPWFWSNQYDLKIQTIGLSSGHDAYIVRGDPAAGSFSILYTRDGKVIALDCVNMARDFIQGRGLITSGVLVAPDVLADPAVPLKTLVPQ